MGFGRNSPGKRREICCAVLAWGLPGRPGQRQSKKEAAMQKIFKLGANFVELDGPEYEWPEILSAIGGALLLLFVLLLGCFVGGVM